MDIWRVYAEQQQGPRYVKMGWEGDLCATRPDFGSPRAAGAATTPRGLTALPGRVCAFTPGDLAAHQDIHTSYAESLFALDGAAFAAERVVGTGSHERIAVEREPGHETRRDILGSTLNRCSPTSNAGRPSAGSG